MALVCAAIGIGVVVRADEDDSLDAISREFSVFLLNPIDEAETADAVSREFSVFLLHTIDEAETTDAISREFSAEIIEPPVIADVPDAATRAGAPYTGPAPTLAGGTLPVTWSLVAGPAGMKIEAFTGIVSWAEPVSAGTPYAITIRATNFAGFNDKTWNLSVAVPQALTSETPFVADFTSINERDYYSVTVEAGKDLEIRLDDLDDMGSSELYIAYGYLPLPTKYEERAIAGTADESTRVRGTRAGTYYVLARAMDVPVLAPSVYIITARYLSLSVAEVKPAEGHNAHPGAPVSSVFGTGFKPGATAVLHLDGQADIPAVITWVDAGTLFAAINVHNATPGAWTLVVSNPDGQTGSVPYTVLEGGVAKLDTNLVLPASVRFHGTATIYVEYANVGSAPMPAPLLVVTARQTGEPGGILTLDANRVVEGFWTSAIPEGFSTSPQFIASGATPGVLRPGESGRVPVYFIGWLQTPDWSYPWINWSVGVLSANDPTPVDWAALKADMRPASMREDAWDAVWANFTSQVGSTWGDYVNMLSANAIYLDELGQHVQDIGQLLAFEFLQADGLSPLRTLASAVDAAAEAPGLPLVFTRSFAEPISQRFELGPLGRGWSHNWEYALTQSTDGTITIAGPGGSRRTFQPDSRNANNYFTQAGDHAKLTALGGGAYTLREPAGLLRVFRTDGKLDYVQDPNGNRITCGYGGDLLTSLTHSSGQHLQLAYSGGYIQSIADQFGRQTTFTYDGNQHLVGAKYYDGRTAAYAYDLSAGPVRHALSQVASSCCNKRYFDYDAYGHLTGTHLESNAETVGFTYDTPGQVTTTDALGGTSKFYFDHRGLLVKTEDALGHAVQLAFDDNYNLVRLTDPAGRFYAYKYDGSGNLTQSTDPLGNDSYFTYQSTFNRLASVKDANGNLTRYDYTGPGNLQSIHYADASHEDWAYDAMGNATTWTNRRGRAIGYTYNSSSQLTAKVFADGSRAEYSYDARGNLSEATTLDNDHAAIEYSAMTYDVNDRLTKITFTGGKWLSFTYDNAGRRASSLDPLGHKLTYAYDAAGRLERMTDESDKLVVRYEYDPAGRLAQKTLGNGMVAVYVYDAAGQLLTLTNRLADETAISWFNYTYDSRGRRTAMDTHYGKWTYGYDDLGQLTHAVLSSTDAQIPNQDLTYLYDALGNRIHTIENGATTQYTTNNLNQYLTVGDTSYVFDADGNLIQETAPSGTTTYTYNDENRLVAVSKSTDSWGYGYDALGNRVATTENGATKRFVIDPIGLGNVVGEYDGAGSRLIRYDHGLGLLSRCDAGGSSASYTFDATGNTHQLVTSGGAIANTYAYEPFGTLLRRTDTIPNPWQFVGEYGVKKEGNGLDFMRARSFSSRNGHFLQMDPVNLLGGDLNLYRYAENDSSLFIDPSGLVIGTFQWPTLIPSLSWQVGGGLNFEHGSTVICGGITFSTTTVVPNIYVLMNHNGGVSGGISYGGFGASYDSGNRSWGPYWNMRGGGGGTPLVNLGNSGGSLGAGTAPGLSASEGFCVEIPSFPSAPPGWVWLPYQGYVPFPCSTGNCGNGGNGATGVSYAFDPNGKVGPIGFGSSGFTAIGTTLAYRIDFENDARAPAPAQQVVVNDPLSSDLDWTTFRLNEVGFGDQLFAVPPDSQHFTSTVPANFPGTAFEVRIEAGIDAGSGQLYATFYSIDPVTGLPPPVNIGFLPPEDGTGRGQAHISYTVSPKVGLATGTQIRNVAAIQFDLGTIITTNQVDPHDASKGTDPNKEALVTIDTGAPVSQVTALPAVTNSYPFTVQWTGADDSNGSGIAKYDVYVSVDGGPFGLWMSTPETSAAMNGQPGHGYAFYTVAVDNVGNTESAPAGADASTNVSLAAGDFDEDGVADVADNCPQQPNADQVDADHDGKGDACDGCPNNPAKTAPGACGCNAADGDRDGDLVPDCQDACPDNPLKTTPGQCGCGVADTDSDGDGVVDCVDGCPHDPHKTNPGVCGCGVADTDSDGDGVPDCSDHCPTSVDVDTDGDGVLDCQDGCPNDRNKTAPGQCGCGVADTDSDGDGTPDCSDGCLTDPLKTTPGQCGCGVADTDSDGDGKADCVDACPNDGLKISPGVCGCGVPDGESDGDDIPDCYDGCPNDSSKTTPGVCGCGQPEIAGCRQVIDHCPDDLNKTEAGICGCGVPDVDSDGDGVPDCHDGCPNDAGKIAPGSCGCGQPEVDGCGSAESEPTDSGRPRPLVGICGAGVEAAMLMSLAGLCMARRTQRRQRA